MCFRRWRLEGESRGHHLFRSCSQKRWSSFFERDWLESRLTRQYDNLWLVDLLANENARR